MTILVTGGAGYIGSHIVNQLVAAGRPPIVVDDLSTGRRERIGDVRLVELDLSSPASVPLLANAMQQAGVTAVIHMAALKRADESMRDPARYYQQNIGQLANVLVAMQQVGVKDLVFSSSAAVYGETGSDRVPEQHPCAPINPYGASKLVGEELIRWTAGAGTVRAVALRYFNVAGAANPLLRDTSGMNFVSILAKCARTGEPVTVFGSDYPTPDGTCVRDYVHVSDLANAHLAALQHLGDLQTEPGAFEVFNVGTGNGVSVSAMIDEFSAAMGRPLASEPGPRRPGDPAYVVASPERFATATGWRPELAVSDMVRSVLDGPTPTS